MAAGRSTYDLERVVLLLHLHVVLDLLVEVLVAGELAVDEHQFLDASLQLM
jgi:hypothetical protein